MSGMASSTPVVPWPVMVWPRATSSISDVTRSAARQNRRSRRRRSRPGCSSRASRGRTRTARAALPTRRAKLTKPTHRVMITAGPSGTAAYASASLSFDPERKPPFRPMPVAGDHAPDDLVTTRGQRGQAYLEEGAVRRADVGIAAVDLPLVAVLHADAAEDRLDLAIKPNPDRWRRCVERVPHPRL